MANFDGSIFVFRDGNKMIARMVVDNEYVTGEAICSPSDVFDYRVGSELAMSRLFDKVIPTTKFKLGDRVRVVGYDGVNDEIKEGMIGTVRNLSDDTVLVEFDKHIVGHNGFGKGYCEYGFGWYMDEDKLELVVNECDDIKVGDRVKTIGTIRANPRIKIGLMGTVKFIDDDGYVLVDFDQFIDGHSGHDDGRYRCKLGHGWYVKPNLIEVVTDNGGVRDVKIGDYILILVSTFTSNEYKKGDIVQVKAISHSGYPSLTEEMSVFEIVTERFEILDRYKKIAKITDVVVVDNTVTSVVFVDKKRIVTETGIMRKHGSYEVLTRRNGEKLLNVAEPKFELGQVVYVKRGLKVNLEYDNITLLHEMKTDRPMTVGAIYHTSGGVYAYDILNGFTYTETMLFSREK